MAAKRSFAAHVFFILIALPSVQLAAVKKIIFMDCSNLI